MPMLECGTKIWINLSTSSIIDQNTELSLSTQLPVYISKPFKPKTKNTQRNRTISSHTQITKILSGQATLPPESQ
jgi:hypothetical protein